jgi:hypothetical protein
MKIAIFYHIAQMGMGAFIYQQQLHRLYTSGLIKAADYIHFGVNGDQELFNIPEKAVVYYNQKENWGSEKETLLCLRNFCKENLDYKIFYFHTKGVSKNSINVNSWRLMLEYFVIDKWKQCVEYLNIYDCVGPEMNIVGPTLWSDGSLTKNDAIPFFAGNFWWANSSYINTIKDRYLISDCRLEKERWIGDGLNGCASKNMSTNFCGPLLNNPYDHYFLEKDYIV